jgi:hypothetical protein
VLTPEEITQRAHDSTHQTTTVFWVVVAAGVLLAVLYPIVRTAVARRRRRAWGDAAAPAPSKTPVTSRMSSAVLLLFVPFLAVVDAALLVVVWRAVSRGDWRVVLGGSGSAAGVVLSWCVVALFLVVVTGTILWLLTYRVTISSDEVATSAFFRTSTLRFTDTAQITFVAERVRARRASPAQLRFDSVDGVTPSSVRITSGGGHVAHVLSVVDEWVRQRPELVRDGATRELFEDRGALLG